MEGIQVQFFAISVFFAFSHARLSVGSLVFEAFVQANKKHSAIAEIISLIFIKFVFLYYSDVTLIYGATGS